MGLLDGKSGIVNGATGLIGRASALLLAEEGASLIVSDLESERQASEELVDRISEAGGRAIFVAGDVVSEDDHRELVAQCVAAFGRLDFAFNNAGIFLKALLEETTSEEWDPVIDVNLKGVWLGMKHQVLQMRKQGGGSIINNSSIAGSLPPPFAAAYVASKAGVIGLTKAGAVEAGSAGIRVNCICTSAVPGPMIDQLGPERQAGITGPQMIKRVTEPDEVAQTVVWLASDRSSLVTGVAFAVDLGASAGIAPNVLGIDPITLQAS
jgi:NAD(P)-dependent dehydrogenase (short-subunit alcohol dehydrogenase family)